MKTVLCHFCLKSGILCPECERKVKSGQVSESYIRVAKILLDLEREYPALQNVSLKQVIEVNGVLAIVVDKGDLTRIKKFRGRIAKALERVTGEKVQIIEDAPSERQFLEHLFSPLSILTINRIWLPDGSVETRVILRGGRKHPIGIDVLKKLAFKIKGLVLRVEFAK